MWWGLALGSPFRALAFSWWRAQCQQEQLQGPGPGAWSCLLLGLCHSTMTSGGTSPEAPGSLVRLWGPGAQPRGADQVRPGASVLWARGWGNGLRVPKSCPGQAEAVTDQGEAQLDTVLAP